MKLLIIGGCGFLGSNLARYGIEQGYDITVFDNLSRFGAGINLKWLQQTGNMKFIYGDTRNKNDIETVIKSGVYDAIFQLAGQVAMTASLENPYKDFETNTVGTFNVLDSIRKYSPKTAIFFSSTNKVYGDLEQYHYIEKDTRYVCKEYPNGFDERIPLNFQSPYGCSKGAADQYMLDYYRMFGVKATVFRHSSMYGSRQFATCDQGWIGWFCEKALEKYKDNNCTPFMISGNGKQVRDILHAKDMIQLYYTALHNVDKVCGNAYNIGGTMEQSLSLLELFTMLEDILNIKLAHEEIPVRISDQKVFVSDIAKIQSKIGWQPEVTAYEGVKNMVEWVKSMY